MFSTQCIAQTDWVSHGHSYFDIFHLKSFWLGYYYPQYMFVSRLQRKKGLKGLVYMPCKAMPSSKVYMSSESRATCYYAARTALAQPYTSITKGVKEAPKALTRFNIDER